MTSIRPKPDDWSWSDFEFIDTHVHLWDLGNPRLRYTYLEPGFIHPQLGDLSALRRNFSVADLRGMFGRVSTTRAVHVQAAFGTEDPYDETLFVQKSIDSYGFPSAIVANVDLFSRRANAALERHLQHPVRGIRDQRKGNYLEDPGYLRGARLLSSFGLHLEVEHQGDLTPVARLAARLPNLSVVLDHAGRPSDLSDVTHSTWRRSMETVAAQPNTWCKISGLGMANPRWDIESISRFIHSCIELFGVDRCFFGTNWPVDSMYSSYEELVAAYRTAVASLTPAERDAVFVENAARLYRI